MIQACLPDPAALSLHRQKPFLHTVPKDAKIELASEAEGPRRIFVIDDEFKIADSLTEILNNNGYEAKAFYTGQSAIDSARIECPDLVLSDVVMPKLNGVETVIAIRKLCPRTRVMLLSGQATTADILKKARAKGYQFHLLPKPIHPDRLLKELAALKKLG